MISLLAFLLFSLYSVIGDPIGPTVTNIRNSTRTITGNYTNNVSGGYIYWTNFDGTEQNRRWKAFLGNVSGTLTLDDANSFTIFDWDIGTITGEIYAVTNASAVNWTNVNCSWAPTGNYTNRTVGEYENRRMSHTRIDNITSTFRNRNHSQMTVGDIVIPENTCYSVRTYINNSNQSGTEYFDEILLWDGDTASAGIMIYATQVEDNQGSYNNETVDFQIIVPENGASGWTGTTPYYFYLELV